MKLSSLRRIRIAVSLVMLALFLMLFLDLRNKLPEQFSTVVLFFQLVPSLLNFITIAAWTSIGFIVVILLTLLFGRVYCSFLCPLGVMQDIISRIIGWFNFRKKKRYRYQRSYAILHYSILAVIVVFFIAGYIAPLGWFDPYSIFGRFMTHMARPLVIYTNNALVSVLQSVSVYSLKPIEFRAFHIVSFGVAAGLLLLVGILAALRGREYCNTVCPVGAVLRFTSRFSLYQLKLDQSLCNSCGLCERACKAGCIDRKKRTLDFSRCVACYNCITACSSKGVVYKRSVGNARQTDFDPARRKFLAGTTVALLGSGGSLSVLAQSEERGQNTKKPESKEFAVSPPGSVSIDHFTSKCTACHLCVSACPKQVLQPSLLDYGLKGFLQPRLDFRTSYCNFDCVICGQVCPAGAILPLTVEEKHLTQVGKAWFIRSNCIVHTDGTDCGACSEHCPTKAVYMVPWRNGLVIPEVNQEICIGCGACEFACPTSPYKAIYVDGNEVHIYAKPPPVGEDSAPKTKPTEDFPF